MKLAAIDIGTNSIHMIIVEATRQNSFEIIAREKEMAKLGAGVFASNYISDRAFEVGLETIRRYVQLADSLGVDEIITAATSAIREAHNGEDFLNQVVAQTGLCPRIISGKEEARLIFLAVRNSIALEEDKALVLDIGGGSTEAVVGDRSKIFFRDSMPLGVLRLLDMFEDKGTVSAEGRGVLEAHIRFVGQQIFEQIHNIGFDRVIGTSGTIRTMGEAAHIAAGGKSLQSVNAEVVQLKDIDCLTEKLLEMELEERAEVDEVSDKRADAIHLGGVLLVKLLQMAGVTEITLCDASLREGMILDYLERHSQELAALPEPKNLRHRKAANLVYKYEADWEENRHVANLALQIFDQTQKLHKYGDFER
ncbi:MAG: Ppx/GppA family phosphatase [Pleurocapsa sp. MO_192.B19]|nr:Ppx/GppA family phosphatase [Pleurocapsa sp. MO_192.B19]